MSQNRKGKLRKQDPVTLGKQYAGTRVSRDTLGADSDDDPFAANTGDDESSIEDAESGEDEDDHDVEVSGSEAFEMNSEESDSPGSSAESHDEDSDEEGEDETDEDDAESEEEDVSSDVEGSAVPRRDSVKRIARDRTNGTKPAVGDDREELRRLMASDQKTIAATISEAAKADAAKGKAVKEQRATFDALLNTRIKLQKGLNAINEMSAVVGGQKEEAGGDESEAADEEAIKSAESAALALWSTLEELRSALADAHSKNESKKRKRPSVTPTTTTSTLWEHMSDLESESLLHRRSVLDKWSSKVRATSTSLPNARGKLLGSASGQQSITTVLDAHVATELGDRSSKRARQSGQTNGTGSGNDTESVYDDTAFYQSLLRDLVEQRMSSSEAMAGGLDTLSQLPSRLPIHPVTGMRNDKVKRDVDTRASKGRKMRYNVHEKLQNFMAPEDRGSWTVRARNEFFASLLGKTASGLLGEGDESDSDAESDQDREEGGLRLFRN